MKKIFFLFLFFGSLLASAQIQKVEPPFWWVGFENPKLQIMVYGNNIGKATPKIEARGISLEKVHRADSPNYLFLDLVISEESEAKSFEIEFTTGKTSEKITYELKARSHSGQDFVGFDSSDVVYLITPDRFANGDPSNDIDKSLLEKTIDRQDDYARHGGDIRGIINHLDYIEEMGFTAIWPSPLLINDMASSSYHGYAMTDFYKVDPRFGTLNEYRELSQKAKTRGIKLIMDQVANHSGIEHWWMDDLPFNDWINYQERFENKEKIVYSNHQRTTNQDLYAADTDKKEMVEGWFVDTMPDLNQKNPFMATYLIQNSIWWIETLELGGIRQDTYPYPDKDFMSAWAGAIMQEYPNFTIVGEEWSNNPLLIAYWQQGFKGSDGYESNLKSTMDFAMQENIVKGLNEDETWGTGFIKMYAGLANDFIYPSPKDIMIFLDNHDMSRIYTQLGEDVTKTKMALAYMLTLPRIPQIYYGTEILMNDTAKPGDHGLIRTDFPGGWENDEINAFTGKGLSQPQREMQTFLKELLNYRKNSEAIHRGKTLHFAPKDNIHVLSRIANDEKVVLILNKNEGTFSLDLSRFSELNLEHTTLKNVISGEHFIWNDELTLAGKDVYMFTTKID